MNASSDLPLPVFSDDANPAAGELNAGLDRIEIVVGDITTLTVEAIVNAANSRLAGGGGVDGAIHRAAGSDRLQAYTREHYPQGCRTGLAVASPAFDLEARGVRRILHTVGPVWEEGGEVGDGEAHPALEKVGGRREDVLLASCYVNCLRLCVQEELGSVAFPAISTGVYGFPKARAAQIALGHVLGHLREHQLPRRVVFCCFDDDDATTYRAVLDRRGEWMANRRRV